MAKTRGSFFDTLERTRIVIDPSEMLCSGSFLILSQQAIGYPIKLLPYAAGRTLHVEFDSLGRLASASSTRMMKKVWPEIQHLFDRVEGGWRLREQSWLTVQIVSADRQSLRHLLDRLIAFWGSACVYCGREGGFLEIEHIVPVVRGGTDDITNLTLACRACNSKKRTKTASEFGHPHIHDMAARIQ